MYNVASLDGYGEVMEETSELFEEYDDAYDYAVEASKHDGSAVIRTKTDKGWWIIEYFVGGRPDSLGDDYDEDWETSADPEMALFMLIHKEDE